METKLEEKHLATYLPYCLELKANDTVVPGVMVSLCSGMPGLLFYEDKDSIEYYDLKDLKPLLFNLADLTLINDKTGHPFFIDVLQVVCPLPFQGQNNKFWKAMITGTDNKIKSTGFLEIDNKFNDYSFSIDLENGDLLIYHCDNLGVPDGLFNYFNELAKYHFDFQGLIEAGLALNKLDYK